MERIEALRAATLDGVPHGFFLNRGGVSEGVYESLNCGPGSADRPEAVAENRRRVAAHIGVAPERLLTLRQTHSARCVTVEGPWRGPAPEADALATRTPRLALGALAADCAPVLFADREAGVVAAAHAGWRGAVGGVLEATLEAMRALGAEPGRVRAAVGPCIAQDSYEVGEEFVARFLEEDPANGRFFARAPGERARFDLPAYVLARLAAAGVAEAGWIGVCAFADRRCFSNRRARRDGATDYGRMISVIRLP